MQTRPSVKIDIATAKAAIKRALDELIDQALAAKDDNDFADVDEIYTAFGEVKMVAVLLDHLDGFLEADTSLNP